MKKILYTSILSLFVTAGALAQENRGKYDLDLYQRKLSVVPKVQFGLLAEAAPMVFGASAQYCIMPKIIAQCTFLTGNATNVEAGVVYAMKNRIVNKEKFLYLKEGSSTKTYLAQKCIVNVHKIFGIRGGFFRWGLEEVDSYDMIKLGLGETVLETTINGTVTTSSINQGSSGGPTGGKFSYNPMGLYTGIYMYSGLHHTNAAMETGMSAKGARNLYQLISLDLLLGTTLVKSTLPAVKINDLKGMGMPAGARFNYEVGMYFGKRQDLGAYVNTEFSVYPGTTKNFGGFLGVGVRFNLLGKVVSN